MPNSETPENNPSNISRVAVKPPPFWKPNPTLWFAQLEAQFDISGITLDSTKFNHAISAIESDVLNSVSDIILQPPASDKYDALKKRLIDLHSQSAESKIRTLLQGEELGDRRPSQLLARMRSLAGNTVGEPLLKSLWISRLPANIQSILAALSEDLSKLAEIADKIADVATPIINSASVTEHAQPRPIPILEQQITELTKQVKELSTIVRRERMPVSSPPRFRTRSTSRSRNYKEPSNNLCFYHTNFGTKARKCQPPCSFHSSGN